MERGYGSVYDRSTLFQEFIWARQDGLGRGLIDHWCRGHMEYHRSFEVFAAG